jgi:hypothetical protein
MQTSAATTFVPTPGKRLFIAGCVTLFLFSAVHMVPMFAEFFTEPTDPLEIEAERALAAVKVDMGPFHTHFGKLVQLLSVSYSALLFFVVALNLVALPAVVAHGRLRAMAMVNVIFVGILLATSVIFQFPPPGVFCLIAGAFFIGAAMKAKPRFPQ